MATKTALLAALTLLLLCAAGAARGSVISTDNSFPCKARLPECAALIPPPKEFFFVCSAGGGVGGSVYTVCDPAQPAQPVGGNQRE